MPPTPLSPDFDPLILPCGTTALSGFGGSLRPCCPKTAPGFAVCSVRIVLRRSSLRAVPTEPPEGTSPIPVRFARPARKPPWRRSRSALPDPKVDQNFPGRSSGPGAILRRVSAIPATGGLRRSDAEASRLRLSPRCPSLLPGCPVRGAAFRRDPRSFHPKASWPRFGTSVCFARQSRLHAPVERSGGCRSYFETAILTLRIGRPFRRPSP